jgi:HEAT repeat protein
MWSSSMLLAGVVGAGLVATCLPSMLRAVDKADVPRLIKQLGDKDVLLRRQAAELLSRLGPDAKPATEALMKALQDNDAFVVRFAAKALGGIGPEAKQAIPTLARLLRHESTEISDAASEALGNMGPDAVGPLVAALKEDDIFVKKQVVRALGKLGSDAAPAVPELVETYKSLPMRPGLVRRNVNAAELRIAIVQTLGEIGPGAKAALPVLRETLNDQQLRDRGLRQAINQAIRKIERPARAKPGTAE